MPSWDLMTKNTKLADPKRGGVLGPLGGWGCRGSPPPSARDVGPHPGDGLEGLGGQPWKAAGSGKVPGGSN